MLKQNQGNANGIRMGLKALSFHPFGEHQYCDGSWCGYLHKGANYKFKSLPYGRPLNDPVLKEELNSVFEGFQCAADKLANTDSTQANENFNNIVASKAPKSCCYAGSDSLNFRVGAAVLQKNDGYSYVSSVNERIGMSPGKYCVSRASYLDNQERKRRMKSQTRCAKKRRIELKANKYLKQSVQELREGDTYTTGIDLVQKTQDIQEIPSPSTEPVPRPIELTDQPVVYFDLETTGLARTSHITQLAAVGPKGCLNVYVIPRIPISEPASRVTGLAMKNGMLTQNGKPVSAVPVKQALLTLCDFLGPEPCILVGHNIKSFDCRVLYNAAVATDMVDQLSSHIAGFVDSYKVFKTSYPECEKYSQVALVSKFVGESSVHMML
ncbi:uncharacterized protein [Ptychodera flava]|uniref:uncharacterized protein n=1 Tax=Ptychodera flava TaxID=63121 RepID=UPI00396A1F10